MKSLVIERCDGIAIIDPESLVGRYASLQHLELGCEAIEISKAEEPQALVPLEGQSCALILRTKSKLEECEQEDLLSLGFRSVPYHNPPASAQFPCTLMMQYGAPERALPLQSVRSSLYDPFHRGISTSFARDSEEHTLLLSKEYQAFLEATPWSLCYTDEIFE